MSSVFLKKYEIRRCLLDTGVFQRKEERNEKTTIATYTLIINPIC